MNNNEKEVVSRIANSPLKFHPDQEIDPKYIGDHKEFYALFKSESTTKRDLPNPERIEIGITDGFDFGDAPGK